MMRISRYINPEYENFDFSFDKNYICTKYIIEAFELHVARKEFSCQNCKKSYDAGNFYMGDSEKFCMNCFEEKFKKSELLI